jgi:hypothetical protein
MFFKKYYLLVSLLFLVQITFGQKHQFRMNEPARDSFIYRVTESIDFFIKSDAGIDTSKELKMVDYKFIAQPTKSNTHQNFNVVIKDILIQKSDMEKTFFFDSKEKDYGLSAKGYEELIDHNFNITFDKLGNLERINNFDKVYDHNFGAADIFSTSDFETIKEQVKTQFSNQTIE